MIKEEKCYYIECDRSGEVYEDCDGCSLFSDKDELKELATEDGWREIDSKWYSPEYVGYDPDTCRDIVID